MRKARLLCVAVPVAFVTMTASASAAVPTNSAPPSIWPPTNTAYVGQRLGELSGTWLGPVTSYSEQWLQCDASGQGCAPIPGATGQAYYLQASDLGHTVRVQQIAINGDGPSAPAVSAPSVLVTQRPVAPYNTVRPTITGQAAVGATLTESPGSWSGTMPIRFSYQWQRCSLEPIPGKPGYAQPVCKPIPGATKQTHRVTAADKRKNLYATVTATNVAGAGQANPEHATVINPTTSLRHQPKVLGLPRAVRSVPWMLAHGGVTSSFRATRPGRLDITWHAVLKGKSVLVARAHVRFHRRGRLKVKTRLTKRGKAAFARNYRLPVFVDGKFTPTTGADAGTPTITVISVTPIIF
jgi:hypothetical protein